MRRIMFQRYKKKKIRKSFLFFSYNFFLKRKQLLFLLGNVVLQQRTRKYNYLFRLMEECLIDIEDDESERIDDDEDSLNEIDNIEERSGSETE